MVNTKNTLARVDNQFLDWLEGINEQREKRDLKKLSVRFFTLLILQSKLSYNLQNHLITYVEVGDD